MRMRLLLGGALAATTLTACGSLEANNYPIEPEPSQSSATPTPSPFTTTPTPTPTPTATPVP